MHLFYPHKENRPVLLRVLDPLLHLVGLGVGFEVNYITAILLQGEDFLDGGMSPFGGLHGALGPAPACPLAPPVVGGIEHPVFLQRGGGFGQSVAVQRHLINAAHHGGGLRVDHPKAGIVRALDVPIGRRGQRHAGIAFHLVYDPALLGYIAGVVFVHDVPCVGEKDALAIRYDIKKTAVYINNKTAVLFDDYWE